MLATGAGIEDRAIRIARGIVARSLLDLAPRAGAAEDERTRSKGLRRSLVARELRRLPQNRLLPGKTQPGEIIKAIRDQTIGAAKRVDILDAHEKAPAGLRRHPRIQQGGKGVPEMQMPIRAGRETENGLHAGRQTALS